MPCRLATSLATLTQAMRRRFPPWQNPPSANDKHDDDLKWAEEGEEDPLEEPLPVPEPKEAPPEP